MLKVRLVKVQVYLNNHVMFDDRLANIMIYCKVNSKITDGHISYIYNIFTIFHGWIMDDLRSLIAPPLILPFICTICRQRNCISSSILNSLDLGRKFTIRWFLSSDIMLCKPLVRNVCVILRRKFLVDAHD